MREGNLMVINHAGNLKNEYFLSYMKLIMNTRQCSLEQAKKYTIENFFGLNTDSLGKQTYENFLRAYQELKQISK